MLNETFSVNFKHRGIHDCRHNDFPLAIRELYNNDVTKFDFNSRLSGLPEFQDYNMDHTDLARMRKGQMGGQVILIIIMRYAVLPFTI